jgi:hypothetical protein
MGLAVCALVIGSAVFAVAGVPDLQQSTAVRTDLSVNTISVYSLPNGGGRTFAAGFLPGGAAGNATITLTLLDGLGVPVVDFPFEDMWVESAGTGLENGLVSCGGNATADFSTSDLGVTSWNAAMFAGGQSTTVCLVTINGDPLTSNAGLLISFNSADINGDGVVNLSDGGFFTQDLFGAYNYRSDFNYDGNLNVSDAGFMSNGLGAACP